MKAQRIGCDILSYDENGQPVCLEVKTSCESGSTFVMTRRELEMAQKLTGMGERYIITCITNWRKPSRQVREIPYEDFLSAYDVAAHRFTCVPKRDRRETITGLAYYRKLRGLKVRELAEAVGVGQHKWSLYETGEPLPPVTVLLRVSEVLDASIDQLLDSYAPLEA